MMLAILIALYAGVVAFDFVPHLKESPKGEKALYLILLAVSFSLLSVSVLGVKVPSPAEPLQQAVKAVFRIP